MLYLISSKISVDFFQELSFLDLLFQVHIQLIFPEISSCLIGHIISVKRGGLCDSWKPSFLPGLIFNWGTFSRQVAVR